MYKYYSSKLVISMTLLMMILPQALPAQNAAEVLTNAKILELVKMGLGESLIVAKISRSVCQCDTTTTAIAKLKAAKVSDAIIMAMMDSSEPVPVRLTPTAPTHNVVETKGTTSIASVDTTADAGPAALRQISEPGVYLFEGGKMTSIEPSVFSGTKSNFLVGVITYGIKKTKIRAKVRGKSANLQVGSSQPTFYFVFNPDLKNSGATMAGGLWWGMPATSPAEFMMVQMETKKASREAVMGEYGTFTGMSTGARDQDVREYSFEKLRAGLYKVVPKTQLAPGEYCFYYAANVAGLGLAGGKIFDFSVK